MPQLMPLNWIFSSMMLFLLLTSACFIYSNNQSKIKLDNLLIINKNDKKLWLW